MTDLKTVKALAQQSQEPPLGLWQLSSRKSPWMKMAMLGIIRCPSVVRFLSPYASAQCERRSGLAVLTMVRTLFQP